MRKLIAVFLLVAFPVSAKPTVINLEWAEFREITGLIRFRPKVTVFMGKDGHEKIRMKLERVSDSGITLSRQGRRVLARREDVHSVRISPRFGNPLKWRLIAAAAAYPLWLGGLTLGLAIPSGIPEGRWYNNRNAGQGMIVGFGLPAAVYLLAQRADRRSGLIIVNLIEAKEDPK